MLHDLFSFEKVQLVHELCLLYKIRDSLQSGLLWVEGSEEYAPVDSLLIKPEIWKDLQEEYSDLVGISPDFNDVLEGIDKHVNKKYEFLDSKIISDPDLKIENGNIVLSPLTAEKEENLADFLSNSFDSYLPRVYLSSLIPEVANWINLQSFFTHAGGGTSRLDNLEAHLLAAIFAQACNIDLTNMAKLCGLSLSQLIWVTNWYLREETISRANDALVNFQHNLELSQFWGDGSFSSSDGQRFPVAVKTKNATYNPKYFGVKKGLTFMTWVSDQLAQYHVAVTPTNDRDATHVLEGLLQNRTDLHIQAHTTDTAGYTHIIFALFNLVDIIFEPRIKDIGRQRLFRLPTTPKTQNLEKLIDSEIDVQLIENHWTEMLRIAGSLKMGRANVSTIVKKLQSASPSNKLVLALQEYGKLMKTSFLLDYLADQNYRRRILIQLNKGESIHALRKYIYFWNEGKIRKRQPVDQLNQASCLNLVSNISSLDKIRTARF